MQESLSAVCERVFERCLAPSTACGEGCDNMTMILVKFKHPIQKSNSSDPSSSEQSSIQTETDNPSQNVSPDSNGDATKQTAAESNNPLQTPAAKAEDAAK